MYRDRMKPLTIKIGSYVYKNVPVDEWTITLTSNTKVITFAQFVEAIVNKQETNGFTLSFQILVNGKDYDIEVARLRDAIASKEVCKITLPLGFTTELTMHCISLSEKWNIRDSRGLTPVDVSFHTTLDNLSLPKSSISVSEDILKAKEEHDDNLIEYVDKIEPSKLTTVFNNIKSSYEKYNNMMTDIYSANTDIISQIQGLKTEFDNIRTSTKLNLRMATHSFHRLLDIPRIFGGNSKDNTRFFNRANSDLQSDTVLDSDPTSYLIIGSSLLSAHSISLSKYIDTENVSRKVVSNDLKSLMLKHKVFTEKIQGKSASSLFILVNNGFLPDTSVLNALDILVSKTFNNLESAIFQFKTEMSITSNQYIDYEVLVTKLYKVKNQYELQQKLDQIIEMNNIKGENLFGLFPNKTIIYLV